MRYSKSKIIITSIIVTFSFIFLIVLIFKGISYSKEISSIDPESTEKKVVKTEEKTKVKTSVSETKTNNKETKKETKTIEKTPSKKETKVENKKVVQEEPKETVVKNEAKKELSGKYKLAQLIVDGKSYSDSELKKLKKEGNPLSLEMNDGAATLIVLDTNGIFEYDNDYFYDGKNKYQYSKNTDRVRIIIGNKNMLFIKE